MLLKRIVSHRRDFTCATDTASSYFCWSFQSAFDVDGCDAGDDYTCNVLKSFDQNWNTKAKPLVDNTRLISSQSSMCVERCHMSAIAKVSDAVVFCSASV